MAENDINITYETLFDIARREKMQEDLQKLDADFFSNLTKYISEKQKILAKKPEGNIFSRDERQITQKQIENIRKLVSELYARRERKIINLAIIKSRTNSKLIDTTTLLPQEKNLFLYVFKILNESKKNILYNLLQAKMPQPIDASACFRTLQSAQNSAQGQEKPAEEKSSAIEKIIKFLSPVPKFVGKELETYGPFEKEDTARLPLEIADVLIKKGRAEEVKP
ncbi:MAG: hypothetical protein ACLFPQ_05680 [Candidatus Woesearchaeota archaeon]